MTSDDLTLGEFGEPYLIVDRVGMEVEYRGPIVIGRNRKLDGDITWAAFWRVGRDDDGAD